MLRRISTLLTIALFAAMLTGVFAVAETETETYTIYRYIDEERHLVCKETWEYRIVDGERVSGKVLEDESEEYEEEHTIVDGKCIYCGPVDKATEISPSPTIGEPIVAPATEEETESEDGSSGGDEAGVIAETTFAAASGAVIAKGAPAADVLKAVLAAIPADAQISVTGVDAETADKLLALITNGGSQDELMALLTGFPVETVDGVECYIVTLAYTDASGNAVTETYAFSTADGTLVKVY